MARKSRRAYSPEDNSTLNGAIFGSYQQDIMMVLRKFNESVDHIFEAESRVLVPAQGHYNLDKRGIIVEYKGSKDSFEENFNKYQLELKEMAHKLDKRTCLYEYPFKNEILDITKWVDWGNTKVAYNYEL